MAFLGIEDQAAVDFIRADDQVVPLGEIGQAEQFVAAPAAAYRVVRMAEQEQLAGRGQGRLHGRRVPVPGACLAAPEFEAIQPAFRETRCGQKGRVDRCRGQHLAIDGPAGDVEAGDQAW